MARSAAVTRRVFLPCVAAGAAFLAQPVLMAMAEPQTRTQPQSTAAAKRHTRLIAPRHLDTIAQAHEIGRLLTDAPDNALFTLELHGEGLIRPDVAWELARHARAAPGKLTVRINGEKNGRINGLAVLVGLCAAKLELPATGRIAGVLDEEAVRALCPRDAKIDIMLDELCAWADGPREAPDGAGPAAPAPTPIAACILRPDRCTDASGIRQQPFAHMEAATLIGLGRAAAASGQPPKGERTTLLGSLSERRDEALAAIEAAKAAMDAAADALDLPDPDQRSAAKSTYARAADKASESLQLATRRIDAADALLREVPEILSTPAPGQSERPDAAAYSRRWRSAISGGRDRTDRLRAKCEEFRRVSQR